MASRDRSARLAVWVGGEVSTVPMALLRIGLALLLWARHGEAMVLVHADGPARAVLSLLFFASSAAMLVGWWSRTATALAAGATAATYFGLGADHHHHYLLMAATALCACAPCGRSLSVDRWRALAAGTPAPERGSRLGLRLITAQLSAVYFWTAFDKLDPAFLGGARIEQIVGHYYLGSDMSPGTSYKFGWAAAAIVVAALEGALAFGLWWPRTHRVLLPLGVALHAALYVLLPVATFSATMVLLYLAALDPAAVERVVVRLTSRAGVGAPAR